MKDFTRAVALGLLITNFGNAAVTEWVETKLGEDWYYRLCWDTYEKAWFDEPSQTFMQVPYAHAPEVPEGFKSRTECVLSGFPFKPRKFWSQDMDTQLLFLKDPIIKHDLPTITNKGREDLANLVVYSVAPKGKPYPAGLEENFEESVWKTLNNGGYDIPFDEFTASLRSLLIPEERLYSAPLIVYFSKKLATRYDFHYKGKNKWDNRLTKIVQRPSEFEVLTGTPDLGVVVYERKE